MVTKRTHHKEPSLIGMTIFGLGLTAIGGWLYAKFGGVLKSSVPASAPAGEVTPPQIPVANIPLNPPEPPPPVAPPIQPINPVPAPVEEGGHEWTPAPADYSPYFHIGNKIGIQGPTNPYSQWSVVWTITGIDSTDPQNPIYFVLQQGSYGAEPFTYPCREFDSRYSTYTSWE